MSHRLRIFPLVDKVICLDKGSYVIGSHEYLYEKSEVYHQIFDQQRGDNRG
jgi:ABC-type transport system involved in cytochrome bd biosynthesis fused ATPase/permease subunit